MSFEKKGEEGGNCIGGKSKVELDLSFLPSSSSDPFLSTPNHQQPSQPDLTPHQLPIPPLPPSIMSLKALPRRTLSLLPRPHLLLLPPTARRPFFSSLPSLPSLLSGGAAGSGSGRTTNGGGPDGDEHHYIEEKVLPLVSVSLSSIPNQRAQTKMSSLSFLLPPLLPPFTGFDLSQLHPPRTLLSSSQRTFLLNLRSLLYSFNHSSSLPLLDFGGYDLAR